METPASPGIDARGRLPSETKSERVDSVMELPPNLYQDETTTVLNLTDFKELTTLPSELSKLRSLEKLVLRNNKFESIPEVVYALERLTHLDAGNNSLSVVGEQLGRLTFLDTLLVDKNHVQKISDGIRECDNLRTLDVSANGMTELPGSVAGLAGLRELRLSGNSLQGLPAQMASLRYLEVLDVSGNELTAVPGVLTRMTSLTKLYLHRNHIREIPPELSNLARLVELDVGENKLESLPRDVHKFSCMKYLNASFNLLNELPENLTWVRSLRMLSVVENSLTSLPQDIGKLGNLTELHVDGNDIGQLPSSFVKLKNLAVFSANSNAVDKLPVGLRKLTQLRVLSLRKNKIEILSEDFGRLAGIEEVNLDHNEIAEFPSPLLFLKGLLKLSLGHNHLKDVPRLIANLSDLEELNLDHNELSDASLDNLFLLEKLRRLSLANNSLRDIPSHFSFVLPHLKEFNLANNRLTDELVTASQAGIPELRSYLLNRQDDIEEDPYFDDSVEDENTITITPSRKVTQTYTLPGGYVLTVPPGSVERPVQISASCDVNNNNDNNNSNLPPLKDLEFYQSDALVFAPSQVAFKKAVTLSRRHVSQDGGREIVVMKSGDGRTWKALPTSVENGEVTVTVRRLSMFIAISRPHRDAFSIDKDGATIVSETDRKVVINIPEAVAVEDNLPMSLEVHACDADLIQDVFESQGDSVDAAFSPMVYVNRMDAERIRLGQAVTVSIPLPSTLSQIGMQDFKQTDLCILKDAHNDGDWTDITERASFTVENGVVKLQRKTFSGYSALRVKRANKPKAASYANAVSKYTREGQHKVKVLLLQHVRDRKKLLMDIVEQRGQNVQLLYKRLKMLRRRGYRPYYETDLPYSEDVHLRSGGTIRNEVSDGFVLKTRKNRKTFYPEQENHWFAYVEAAAPDDGEGCRQQSRVGFMIFYNDAAEHEGRQEPLAELQFVLPKIARPRSRRSSASVTTTFDLRERRKIFQFLASKIMSHEWKNLARTLGLSEYQIDEIEYANPRDKAEQVYKMLALWEGSLRNTGKCVQDLVSALRDTGLPWLIAELKQRFPELYKK